eukprot:CAMPEP_0115032282 /NCGR_PEP_ID=MMETSP0216-20121206/39066_1 /TAXON_ID=223996 /ORGANISM="Protocruzia adherens, Strain Boccale" /LENGTH=126 /DNA_ID=CAMNT_0002410153 /DNA_START=407 /DNA_END=787 /DNA_ORIENTATION=-
MERAKQPKVSRRERMLSGVPLTKIEGEQQQQVIGGSSPTLHHHSKLSTNYPGSQSYGTVPNYPDSETDLSHRGAGETKRLILDEKVVTPKGEDNATSRWAEGSKRTREATSNVDPGRNHVEEENLQ